MSFETAKVTPIIMCGGKGTRLWPMSRSARPKQFLQLTGDMSLFQQTLRRVSAADRYNPAIVVTNNDYRFLVAEQAFEADVALEAILLEPVARNTAPAIAAAAHYALSHGGEQTLLVLASDHAIHDGAEFQNCVDRARAAADASALVTFGIRPTEAATGFGYIETGELVSPGVSKVVQFVEKPPLAEAERMLKAGNYLWNSGMFVFRTDVFIAECQTHAPEVLVSASDAVDKARKDLDFVRLDSDAFSAAPNISVDYAIFERTQNAAAVLADFDWSDLGSWDAVWKVSDKDAQANVTRGPVSIADVNNSLVFADGLHVVVSGLDDVAVIAGQDAVYVGRLSDAQSVGALVKMLSADPLTSHLTESHVTNYRPWGGYTSVLIGERFQVKRLFVKQGKKLSLQQHHHRAEHWVVVRGTAEVTVDGEVRTLGENQSAYIPLGAVHRLANPGKILLELIEVQTGSYLGEDDIIRMEDEFGRT